jgi:hypothetical protein
MIKYLKMTQVVNILIIQASAAGIAQNYIVLGKNDVNALKRGGNFSCMFCCR